jgi:hypothetical protein
VGTVAVRPRALAAALLTAVLVGAGVRGLLTGSSRPRAPSTAGTASATHTDAFGIPDQFARSRAGAVTAAASDVRQGQRLFELAASARAPALQAMAASAAAPAYVAEQTQALAELDGIAARGEGTLTWDVTVLGTRVDAYSPTRAVVSLWRVGVLSIGGLTAPLAEWATVRVELVWERGDWRIWSETQTPGPTPMLHPAEAPSTPEQLRLALAGFERYPDASPF